MVAVIVLDLSLVLRPANVEKLKFSSFWVIELGRPTSFLPFLNNLLDASYMSCTVIDPETRRDELDLLERS